MTKCFARMVGYTATAMILCALLFHLTDTWFDEQKSALQFVRDMAYESRRFEALQYRNEVVQHAMEGKVRILCELVGGHLRLREAIVQFQTINKQLIEKLAVQDMDQDLVGPYLPPPTEPEVVGRFILRWLRADVAPWPPHKAKRLLADFEREFHELFGRASLSDSSTDAELPRPNTGGKREPRCELR